MTKKKPPRRGTTRVELIQQTTRALEQVLIGLEPLTFTERVSVIRWAYYDAHVALYQGDAKSFPEAPR